MPEVGRYRNVIALAAILALATTAAAQQRPPVTSLRGELGVEDANPPPNIAKQAMPADGKFGRAYRQQPPLIPHRIEGYQVTRDFNQCLSCHDWPASVKSGALKLPESHYVGPDGQRLDRVSGALFFCTQCHVPQNDAKPLVTNTFMNATEVK
jgi:cytochrome c-type protein NapB